MNQENKTIIVLPNILNNPVYVEGLRQPLEAVAEVLEAQGKEYMGQALRYAATICDTYSKVVIHQTAVVDGTKKSNK